MNRLFRYVVCAILLLGVAAPVDAAYEAAGNVVSTRVGADVVDFVLEGGALVRVQAVDKDIVRVRVAPGGQLSTLVTHATVPGGTNPAGAVIYDLADVTYIVAQNVIVAAMKRPFRTFVWRPDGTIVMADLESAFGWDRATGLVLTRKWAQPEEHFFGVGERGGPLNRRGRRFAMKNVDNGGYGEFTDPLYVSIPYYLGMLRGNAYGVFLDNPATPFFDFDAGADGVTTFGALKGDLDYYVMAGPSPRSVSHAYSRLTGFPQLPPKWTLGYQQSRYGYKTQDEILSIAYALRWLRVPADVMYFDIDYMDAMQMFTWNSAAFPDPAWMNELLHQLGFHTVNIMEPLVLRSDRLWTYFSTLGFLLKDTAGTTLVNEIWAGMVSWFDFTNLQARSWYKEYLKAFLTTGIDAVWNDLNEPAQNYMPEAIYNFDGQPRTDLEARNVFALIQARTSIEAQLELRPDTRPWLLSRGGYSGIQRYGANWGGDQGTSFDDMRISVQMQQSMALSGQNQYGHDVGGFLGSPSAELFIRWLELSSYTPLFRNHALNTTAQREPWQFGGGNLDLIREVINERYRLMPYLYSAMRRASTEGIPALSPTLFHFPQDTTTYRQDYEFMLGPSLLVAPVIEEGATARTLYLPAGADWFNTATGVRHSGGLKVTVAAPLGRAPVFARAGAVIPKGPVTQFVDEQPLRDVRLHLYPGPSTVFDLYEDDGATLQYRQNGFLQTRVERVNEANGFSCDVRRVAGSWLPPQDRRWWMEFHAAGGRPASVTLNGAPLAEAPTEAVLAAQSSGWTVLPGDRVLVSVPDMSGALNVRLIY